jgi:hypothetical protein
LKRIIVVLLTAIIFLPTGVSAQTRKRSTTQKAKATPATPQRTVEARTAGATRVADQIKILTKFIYLLGGVAKGLEGVDDAVRRNEASPAVLQQAQQNKATVKTSLQNVREGLDKLEIDFRAAPELQPYYIKLAGVANGAATAEDQAAANHFDQAGRSLLGVINQLTDVLLAMR